MPEISEVRIMSEFINKRAKEVDYFISISKSPEHKSKTDLHLPFERFQLSATSRGKELMVRFNDLDFKYQEPDSRDLIFTMGMGGNWNYSNDIFSIPKHTHLMIADSKGGVLGMHDVRRFARWEWREWNWERGPDPVRDFEAFKNNVWRDLIKHPTKTAFKKPIYEVLMNQTYFNGIGNYLRAEILGRIDMDPKTPGKDYILATSDTFFDIVRKTAEESYVLGGGQFKDWYNLEDRKGKKWESFQEWMQFYFNKGRCVNIKDSNGRVFWMDKKWIK